MLVAITGGIGSGKTTVLQMIASLGGNIINADEINKQLLSQEFYIEKIREAFPDAIEGGIINKEKLAKKVFYDKKALQRLNKIAHPIINEQIMRKACTLEGIIYVEVPLLVESNMQKHFDRIWLVKASKSLRFNRIQARSGIDKCLARRIMSTQESDRKREKYATDIIINNGDNHLLFRRVKELYNNLSKWIG